jgi:hypothetical protein
VRYFIIESDPQFTDLPYYIGWHQKIDVRYIKKGLTSKLPSRELFYVKPNPNIIFAGVIIHSFTPSILITQEIKDIVDKYQSGNIYKEIVLLDDKNGLTKLYYLTVVDEVDCLHESSGFNRQKTVLEKPVLVYEAIKNRSLFKIAGTYSTYNVVRLDLAESMLRRDARGLRLTPVEIR